MSDGFTSAQAASTESPDADVVAVLASKWSWERELLGRAIAEGMTPGTQHIALVLATYADGEGKNIRPSAQTLVQVSGRSRATIFSALRALRQSGWVVQTSRGSAATRRASEYRLSIPPRSSPATSTPTDQ